MNKPCHIHVSEDRRQPKPSELPTLAAVEISSNFSWFSLSDGRKVTIPLAWSKPLDAVSVKQRNNFILSAYNVFLDDIGVENVLSGKEL